METRIALPEKFKARITALLGENDAEMLFSSIEQGDAVKAFRVNRIKTDVDSFESAETEIDRKKADFPPDAYITREEFPGSMPCHHSGAIYMQDISAMSTVCAVKLEGGECVLDSCSAPGGKTAQLADMVGCGGVVVANEFDKKRCRILQSNIERMGARNTVICNLDTALLAEQYPEKFDLVLCDAPCSGEGMFRKNPRAVEEWSVENVEMCAERQREILRNVAKCVKRGGRLLYSTCTFSLEENEQNVEWFLNNRADFRLADVCAELKDHSSDGIMLEGCDTDMTKCRRIYPHKSCGEGQFIALLERDGISSKGYIKSENVGEKAKNRAKKREKTKYSPNNDEMISAARDFLKDNLVSYPSGKLTVLGSVIYNSPDIDLPEYNVVASGVAVGECQKGRILPHHQFFSAYGGEHKLKICLSGADETAKRYLRGEELCLDEVKSSGGRIESLDGRTSGWAAVLIDGCAVGGAKVSGGVAKNHYPKGLRNNNYKQ